MEVWKHLSLDARVNSIEYPFGKKINNGIEQV